MRIHAARSLVALSSALASLTLLVAAASPAGAASPSPAPPASASPVPVSASPATAASPSASDAALPEIGRVHATTAFCRAIVEHGAALADDQLADIATTTEALRILVYAPLDRSFFVERRAARAL